MYYYLENPIEGEMKEFPTLASARKYMKETYGVNITKERAGLWTAYYWNSSLKEGFIFYLTRVKE